MIAKTITSRDALATFSKASEVFERNFINDNLVRSLLDNYARVLSDDEILAFYNEEDADCHKSLGCFFETATNQLSKFLKAAATESIGFSVEQSFSIYSLLVSMLLDRILDVSAVVTLNDGTRPYKETALDVYSDGFFSKINARTMRETYEPMYQMGRWASFFRHPKKIGWLLHEPQYLFAGSEELGIILNKETRFRVKIVDDEFIKKHYSTEHNNDDIESYFGFDSKGIVIVLPDIVAVTRDLCECLRNFVEITTQTFYYKMLNEARKRSHSSE